MLSESKKQANVSKRKNESLKELTKSQSGEVS